MRYLSLSGFCCALLLFMTSCGVHRDTVVIKLAHSLDSTHPVHRAMIYMAEQLAKKSHGTMRIDVYPSGQLGSERECIELLQMGGLGMTKTSAAALEGFAPEFKVFGLPYLFKTDAQKWAVLDGPIGEQILESPTSKFLRGLCYYDAGSRSFYANKPINTPDDVKGMKIRVQESPMAFALIRAMGGSATPIAWGELYTALQQGVVDGAENNPPSFYLSRHYEISRYYSLNEHTTVPDVLLISDHLWKSLTKEQQQWLHEAAAESAVYERKLWQEASDHALEEVEKAGVKIIHPDRALFAKAVSGLHDEAAKDPVLGPLLKEISEVNP